MDSNPRPDLPQDRPEDMPHPLPGNARGEHARGRADPSDAARPGDRPHLGYAPPSRWHRGRSARRALLLCFSLLIAATLVRFGYPIAQRIQTNHHFSRCLRYRVPEDRVVYEENLDRARALLALPGYVPVGNSLADSVPAAGAIAQPWSAFYEGWSGSPPPPSAGILFLHERTTRSGKRRLVAVDLINAGNPAGATSITAAYRVFEPPLSLGPAKLLQSGTATTWRPTAGEISGSLTLYAGQPDPQISAHFTIAYRIGAAGGVLDGWLKDDETVVLEGRDAAAAHGLIRPVPASRGSSP